MVRWPRMGVLFLCLASSVLTSSEMAQTESRRLQGNPDAVHLKIGGLLAHPFLSSNSSLPGGFDGLLSSMLRHIVLKGSEIGFSITYDLVPVNTTYDDAVLEVVAGKYDMLLGDYYVSPHRLTLVDFSASWLMTQLTTIKWKGAEGKIAVDMEELSTTDGAVCVLQGTFTAQVTARTYPEVPREFCASQDKCSALLKSGKCEHWVEDSLIAKYLVRNDPSLLLSPATFSRQYLAFPMSQTMNHTVSRALNRLVATAVDDGKMESLLTKYWPKIDVQTAYFHNALRNHHLDIVVIVDAPFVVFDSREEGNSRFSGYIIDMINKAHTDLGFSFKLHMPSDADLSATPIHTGTYSQGNAT